MSDITKLFEVLQSNPTSADLDYLIENYAYVGYVAAEAEGQAEYAEAARKYGEAEAFAQAQAGGERVTVEQAKNLAYLRTYDLRKAEIKARQKAQQLKNLLASTEQAINAIKFLGRYDSPIQPSISVGRR